MSNFNNYIGVDLHKKTCFVTVMNKISSCYHRLKKKKGTGKAKVAGARKLCSVIFAMLTDQQPFREFVPVKQR